MSVKILKLVNNEIIIAEVEDDIASLLEPGKVIFIKTPLRMVIKEEGIAFVLWVPCDMSQPTALRSEHIYFAAEAAEELANEYRSKFGGIVKAPAGLIV
jgi:hypothetical protein